MCCGSFASVRVRRWNTARVTSCSVVPALLNILTYKTSPRSCVPLVASGKAERLNVTPKTISIIRKDITFGKD